MARPRTGLGQSELARNKYDVARRLRSAVRRGAPDRPFVLRNRGPFPAEIAAYTSVLLSVKERALPYVARGNALLAEGRAKLALLDYSCALSLKPDIHEITALKAEALLMLGRYEEALRAFDTALAARPNDAGNLQRPRHRPPGAWPARRRRRRLAPTIRVVAAGTGVRAGLCVVAHGGLRSGFAFAAAGSRKRTRRSVLAALSPDVASPARPTGRAARARWNGERCMAWPPACPARGTTVRGRRAGAGRQRGSPRRNAVSAGRHRLAAGPRGSPAPLGGGRSRGIPRLDRERRGAP